MTGIIFIAKENVIGRIIRKAKLRFFHKHIAATYGTATSPKEIKGLPCVAIRFLPYENINIITDVIVHENVHEVICTKIGEDFNRGLDKIDGSLDLIDYIRGSRGGPQ